MVFKKLHSAQLYLSQDKVNLYSQSMDCLGHIISDAGIHADTNKMHKTWDWWQPHNYHEMQWFLGLVQYLAHFLPDITSYTMPLSLCTHNGRPFIWTPLMNKCFESIKTLTCKAPILKPINPKNLETIWVICDGSKSGVRAVYGRVWNGNHAVQQASYLRSSLLPSRIIRLMNMRWFPSLKHLLSGRTNY